MGPAGLAPPFRIASTPKARGALPATLGLWVAQPDSLQTLGFSVVPENQRIRLLSAPKPRKLSLQYSGVGHSTGTIGLPTAPVPPSCYTNS
jgi:hypothetical protein